MKRIVIKVGSHILTEGEQIAEERMAALVAFIAQLKTSGKEVMLVSSGAVSAGYTKLRVDKNILANRQALAAIGQPLLLSMYQEQFAKFGLLCSQVLLRADVFDSKEHTTHAKNAIDALLANGVVPIINENDTVSIDELVFGDNDRLSAHVAHYFGADFLTILSDIDAFYDKDPNISSDAVQRDVVTSISQAELEAEHTPNNDFATGGIVTKLQAANFMMQKGKQMFLASGFDLASAKSFLLEGKQVGGTLFKSKQ